MVNKNQDLSGFFGKCMKTYSERVGEALPKDPHRNLLVGSKNGYGKAVNSAPSMLYDANGNPVNMMDNPMMQMMMTMAQGMSAMNNEKMVNQHHPEAAIDINQITNDILEQIKYDPDLSKKAQNPQVMQNLIKSEVNSRIAKNNGNFHTEAKRNLATAQSSGLKPRIISEGEANASLDPVIKAQYDSQEKKVLRAKVESAINTLSDENISDLIALKKNVAITLQRAQLDNLAAEGALDSLMVIQQMGLVDKTSLDCGDLSEFKLSKLGKLVVKALTQSE